MNLKNVSRAPYAPRKKKRNKYNGLLFRNPVLVGGLLLAPAVVAVFSLKNAVALTLTLAIVTVPTLGIASLVRRNIPHWQRVPLYSLIAAALLIPAYFVVSPIAPTIFDSVGMYFSLMALNSILYVRAEKFAEYNTITSAMLDGLTYCGGFAIAAVFIGGVRELLAYNTLWGLPVTMPFKISSAALPFAGFLLIGMLAGIGRYFRTQFMRLSQLTTQLQLRRRVELTLPSASVPRRDDGVLADSADKQGGATA